MSGEKTEMRRIRQMSVTTMGELPLPEQFRRLNGFSEPRTICGSASWGGKARGGSLRGRGLDRNLLSGDREAEGRLFQSLSAQNIASSKLGISFNY
jgi:hypothetical protein